MGRRHLPAEDFDREAASARRAAPPVQPREPWPISLSATERSQAMRTRVEDVMKEAICVRPELALKKLVALLVRHGIGAAPVVDADGKALGVVSKTDLIGDLAPGLTAGEVMTSPVQAVPEGSSLADAVSLMSKKKVHRVLVTSESGKVSGVVSSLDVTNWLARPERSSSGPASPACL